MKITMVGLGYIGLPTACLLAAKSDEQVYGYDVNNKLLKSLKNESFTTKEIGLDGLLYEVMKKDKLKVGNKLHKSDTFIIAVPTPFNADKTCDVSYIESATKSICEIVEPGNLIILESTVSPGVTENTCKVIIESETDFKVGKDVFLAYSAERVIPGKIIEELKHNDRIIGGVNEESAKMAKKVYQMFVDGDIHMTDCITAEVTKLMENTYRDVNIALANEFAKIAEVSGFDIWEAVRLANRHPRVNIHSPGPGVGGHCIAVDPWFFVGLDPENSKLIGLSRNINDDMPIYVVDKLLNFNDEIKTIGILGVSYKPDIEDTRTSPSTTIIKEIQKRGLKVLAHDPFVEEYEFGLSELQEVMNASDALILMVDHYVYKTEDFAETLSIIFKNKIVLDTKNALPKMIDNVEVIKLGTKKI